MAKEPLYDQADCVMIYDEHSAKLITRFKYGDKTQGAKTYANWMAQHVQTSMPVSDIDYITPVPIHRKRLLQRSYNQSALIAKFMANELALTFEPTLLKRDKNSPPQASLNRKDRVTNVKGCFAVTPKYATLVEGKSILLIDDVITTGSTVEECTKQLKRAGAKHVYVSTLAKTIK
jgi:ComF family protein